MAIVGPSGCGKSTTLDLIGMVLRPDTCDGFTYAFGATPVDVASLWNRDALDDMAFARRQHVGYVLQTGELLPFLTVLENVELTASVGKRKSAHIDVQELLKTLEISHLKDALPDTLSIGERQRAAIARALASSPEILLADEPTAALDPTLSRIVMRLFLQVAEQANTAVIMVSHDVSLVHEFHFRCVPVTVQQCGDHSVSFLDDRLPEISKRDEGNVPKSTLLAEHLNTDMKLNQSERDNNIAPPKTDSHPLLTYTGWL